MFRGRWRERRSASGRRNRDADKARRYRAVFHSAVDFAIITMDRDGQVTDWNPGAEHVLGWTAGEMRGQAAEDFFTPEDRAEGSPGREMRRALQTGRASDERWHLRKDGSRFWASGEVHPLRDEEGQHLGFLKILRDRTEKRLIRTALRKSEATYRATFDQAAVGVAHVALDGSWLRVNRRLSAMLGYSEAELLEKTFQDITYPDDLETDLGNLRRLLAGEIETYSQEKRYRRKDGSPLWANLTVSLLRDESGAPLHFIAVIEDISGRKRAEEELRQLNDSLEARVREAVAAREEAQAQLAHAQRMQALGQLAGGIAHDFNNVLQAVRGGGEMIKNHPADAEMASRFGRLIVEAADRGSAITQRLLAFSRRSDLRAAPLDATELLASVREILHTLGPGIEIQVQAGAALPLLLAGKGQLETVLINLATNARDAMASGGTLTLSATGSLVPDNGPHHPPVLNPGSYVRFAEQSGGGLFIKSAAGQGTTVTLWLPAAESGISPRSTLPEEASVSSPAAARILVVDDDDLARDVLAAQLTELGYEVVQAEEGIAALALLTAGETIDLLVADLSRPGIDGVALIREAQRQRPRLPAILITVMWGRRRRSPSVAPSACCASLWTRLGWQIRWPCCCKRKHSSCTERLLNQPNLGTADNRLAGDSVRLRRSRCGSRRAMQASGSVGG